MSFELGVVRGIPIRLHITLIFVFLLLVLQLGLFGLPAGVLLFGSVLLHELGHAVVAQRFGIPIAGINLHLLGGMAMMTAPPRTPRHEMLIAAAGPAVSLALAVAFGVLAVLFGGQPALVFSGPADLLAYASVVNLGLGLFNLVPALPMDGGRIFRAALSGSFGELRATKIAATVSRVFGGVFLAVALATGSFSLGLIGLFLFVLVSHEERMAEARAKGGTPVWRPNSGPSSGTDYRPFGPFSDRFGVGRRQPAEAKVVDVSAHPTDPNMVREVYEDPWGRRWVRFRRRYRM